jgi:acyl carrier protein
VVAGWLVEKGVKHIALIGRHAYPDGEGVRALEAAGARVWSLQGDVADEHEMERLLTRLRAEAPPLRGVIHAAADLGAAPIADLSADDLRRMLRPKLQGSVVLERLTRDCEVEFLVLFSSTTALLGASGLAHYAAANAFLDALAPATDSPRRRVVSINWGTWDAMRLASDESQRSFREGGLLPMAASDALDALGRLLASPRPQAMVARIDWSVLKPLHEARRPRPLLTELAVRPASASPRLRGDATPDLAARLARTPPAMRSDLLLDFVQQEVAAVLGTARASAVPIATGLFDLGMDSLMAVELKRRLERGVGRALPATLTFNYPTVAALAGYLESQMAVTASTPAQTETVVAPGVDLDTDLDRLSDDELEARLAARLAQTR